MLHNHFVLNQINKVNHRKEFFKAELSHIRQEVETMNLSAKWTMTAGAREYYETLAIEKAIAADPAKKDAWIKRQLELEPIGLEKTQSDGEEAPNNGFLRTGSPQTARQTHTPDVDR